MKWSEKSLLLIELKKNLDIIPYFLVFVFVLVISIWANGLPLIIKGLLLLLALCQSIHYLNRYLLLSHPQSLSFIEWFPDFLYLELKNHNYQLIDLEQVHFSLFHQCIIFIHLPKKSFFILKAQVEDESFYALTRKIKLIINLKGQMSKI